MQAFWFCLGIAFILGALVDAFQTVVSPRRATGRFRITRIFYTVTWWPWSRFALMVANPKKRETILSYYGPLSLLLLIVVWAGGILIGFGFLYFSLHSPLRDPMFTPSNLRSDLYLSGTTLFTLGIGDLVPLTPTARELVVLESGMGLGFLAMVISYFPVFYQAFSRREVSISLLDARAGSPPTATEIMKRHSFHGGTEALNILLIEWERWSAELLESHISYPLLCYFRSQHTNQSWLSAVTSVLDVCALMIAGVQEHAARQAQLTFAIARHALVDIAQILSLPPVKDGADRLPPERFEELYSQLCQAGIRVCRDGDSMERLRKMRLLYEGYAEALSRHLCMPLPPWITTQPHKDNWLSVARLREQAESAPTDAVNLETALPMALHEDEHHL